MIIISDDGGYEKYIYQTQIQMIDCEPSGNTKYPWTYQVWQNTLCTKFKAEKKITDTMVVHAIEVYTFIIDEKMIEQYHNSMDIKSSVF